MYTLIFNMNIYLDNALTNQSVDYESSENNYYLYSESSVNNSENNSENNKHVIFERPKQFARKTTRKTMRNNQKGGANDAKNRPNGGFAPIYIVDASAKETEKSKDRQFAVKRVGISIGDILKNKMAK